MPRILLAAATIAALIGVAACNRGDPPAAPAPDTNTSASPDTAATIRQRQANYKQMSRASKAIGDQLKADAPSVPDIQAAARTIADFAPHIPQWFPAGSGPESGIRTRAKAEIWQDQEGFGRAAGNFIEAAERFNIAARSGDLAAIRAAQPALGNGCKECHGRFRAPERE